MDVDLDAVIGSDALPGRAHMIERSKARFDSRVFDLERDHLRGIIFCRWGSIRSLVI